MSDAHPTSLNLVAYDADRLVEHRSEVLSEIEQRAQGFANVWLDVEGLDDVDMIRAIGQSHGLHPLTLDDIVDVVQRPKVETYDNYLFIVLRLPRFDDRLSTEQLALVLGQGFVLTFRERPGAGFDTVRRRLTQTPSRMRSARVDYLAYALIDALIDSYFPILEHHGELLEQLEERLVEDPGVALAAQIHRIRRAIMEVRRALWPVRDVLSTLQHKETPYIEPKTRVFLRDCTDHVFQLLDMIEIQREVASVLLDLHLSSLSTRMNEVMKVLTIIATIFIPLGFIAGVYGMNFNPSVSPYNMPELEWRFGYLYALAVMAAVALGMLGYFWGKGWIGNRGARRGRSRDDRTEAD